MSEGNKVDSHICTADCPFDHDFTKEHLQRHLDAGITTILPYTRRGIMPRRGVFRHKTLAAQFARTIRNNGPVIFMPNTVHDKTEYIGGVGTHKSYVFGVLPCGSKVCVILEGIEVNYRLRVPDDMTDSSFTSLMRSQMTSSQINYKNMTTVELLPMREFHTKPVPYKHITFNTTFDRRKCIDTVANMNSMRISAGKLAIETAFDDVGQGNFYFTKAAREYRFNTADWNRLDKYELVSPNPTTNCVYTLRTHVDNYKKLDAEKRALLTRPGHVLAEIINRDPTMVVSWDIETWSPVQNGVVPTPADQGFVIKMICAAYFPYHTDQSHLRVCCTMHPANVRPGMDVIIHCASEQEVLDAHSEIWGYMAPDISVATNGSNFDWPLVREKMRRYGMLVSLKSRFSSLPLQTTGRYADTEENVLKWSFRPEKIKIDATTTATLDVVASFPGLLDTDLTPIFTKMYPRNEVRKAASLNFFLQSNGLESKEDMPYKRMFKIFERANSLKTASAVCHCGSTPDTPPCPLCLECVKEIDCKPLTADMYSTERLDDPTRCCCCTKRPRNLNDMADVAYYCVIDCIRPQQLYVKRMIVGDKRELSTISYTTLYDSFYRADGMKVANLIGAQCHKRGIAFSNVNRNVSDSDKDFYPGAWVFPPNRGLHSDGWIDVIDQSGNKRRVRQRPTTGLDFASLYPSLMMTYNLSPDKVAYTREKADQLAALGYTIHHIVPFEFERGEKKGASGNRKLTAEGWIVRHNGIVNANRDKLIIEAYVKSWVAMIGRTPAIGDDGPIKWADGDDAPLLPPGAVATPVFTPKYGREPLPGENMGIFPFVVKKIFDKRVPIKKEFLYWQGLEETMSEAGLTKTTITDAAGNVIELDYDRDVCFTMNKVDAKQKALKVLANTFYGKSGEFRASIYELLVAAGITCAGQKNIKMVARFVESLGYVVHYGDTDSVYISCPDEVFAECDRVYEETMKVVHAQFEGVPNIPMPTPGSPEADYKAARIAARKVWWTEQVILTQKNISGLTVKVSEMLMRDNGTRSLNMAYEEVGMPSVYCGKKKYYMTPHVKEVNFYPKKPFIRGIDIVKQGQAPITKILGESFIRESLALENERTLMEICMDRIGRFTEMSHDITLFAQSARYKPNVQNVTVKTFVARMTEMHRRFTEDGDHTMAALYEPPEPGDKFEYVVVLKEQRYTLSGTKVTLKKGDCMEYMRVYEASLTCAEPMRLDLAHYMSKAIVGLFARFISGDAEFQPTRQYDFSDKDQYTQFDKECLKAASKFLLGQNTNGIDAAALTARGRDYQAIYKHANKRMRMDLGSRIGSAAYVMHCIDLGNNGSISQQIVSQITEFARNCADLRTDGIVGAWKNRMQPAQAHGDDHPSDVFALRTVYCTATGIGRQRIRRLEALEQVVIGKMYGIARRVGDLLARYNTDIVRIIDDMRRDRTDTEIVLVDDDLDLLHDFAEPEIKLVKEMYDYMTQLAAIYAVRADTSARMVEIEEARSKSVGGCLAPKINARVVATREAAAAAALDDYTWS